MNVPETKLFGRLVTRRGAFLLSQQRGSSRNSRNARCRSRRSSPFDRGFQPQPVNRCLPGKCPAAIDVVETTSSPKIFGLIGHCGISENVSPKAILGKPNAPPVVQFRTMKVGSISFASVDLLESRANNIDFVPTLCGRGEQ